MISEENVTEFLTLTGKLLKHTMQEWKSGVAFGEGALLAYLSENDGATAGTLGKESGFGSGRIANLLKAIEIKGYVTRRRDETDKRKIRVAITEKGRKECEKRKREIFLRCKAMLELLGEADSENALRILRKLSAP